MVWGWLAGCDERVGGEIAFSTPQVPAPSTQEVWGLSDPLPWAGWTCTAERDPDWAEWTGGQRMTLDATPAVVGTPMTVTVTGAIPGDTLDIRRGGICRLDCPATANGGCFHPTRSNLLGQVVADEYGTAEVQIQVSIGWSGAWWVLQATSVGVVDGYVSQPLLTHTEDWEGPFPAQLPYRELAEATIRGLPSPFDAVWALPAGRQGLVRSTAAVRGYSSLLLGTSGSLAWGLFEEIPFGFEYPGSVAIQIGAVGTATGGWYDLELVESDLDQPVYWYEDVDGDGYGDAALAPVWSAAPLAGYAVSAADCDDGDPARAPFAAEICGDGIDQDCDGSDRLCADDPSEAYGSVGTRVIGAGASLDPALEVRWIEAGDLDGDGTNELVVGPLGIARNLERADHDLRTANLVPDGMWMEAAGALADLNGDGATDLVNARDDTVQILLGPLDPYLPWDPVSALTNTQWDDPAWVLAADLDGNSVVDLIVPSPSGVQWIREPMKDPVPQTTFVAGAAVPAVSDLDGDGLDDLVTAEGCVWLGPITDAFADCLRSSDSAVPSSNYDLLASGDLDGDGRPDLVASLGTTVYAVTSGPPWIESSAPNAAWLAIGGGEPVTSLAVATVGEGSGGILAGVAQTPAGLERSWTFAPAAGGVYALEDEARYLTTAGPSRIAADDVDRDGVDEVIVATTGAPWGDRPNPGVVWVLWGE